MGLTDRTILKDLGGGYVIMGDERAVLTATKHRREITAWCVANNVIAQRQVENLSGWDVWHIVDEQQRAWFVLRWG